MVDLNAVEAALGAVLDPELNISLADLGALRTVEAGRAGTRVVVEQATDGSDATAALEAAVREAATAAGGAPLTVEVVPMSEEKRAETATRLKGVGVIGARTRVITIASGKGGVGKSSVTTNLGVALAGMGHSVGLMDADVWGFSIPKMLGIHDRPGVLGGMLVPPVAHGVRAISIEYFVAPDQAIIWRGPMLHKALEQFLSDVLWGSPDFLLIDMPPGTGDVAISVSQFVPNSQSILVTTPQLTAQRVAKRAGLMAAKVNQEVIGVVENMAWFTGDDGRRYPIFGEGGGAALAAELGVDLLGQIPLLLEMGAGADQGQPILVAAPESEAAVAFRSIAAEVVARRPKVRTHPELVIR